jgi:hypothetical protein
VRLLVLPPQPLLPFGRVNGLVDAAAAVSPRGATPTTSAAIPVADVAVAAAAATPAALAL